MNKIKDVKKELILKYESPENSKKIFNNNKNRVNQILKSKWHLWVGTLGGSHY